ncbi:MAG: helix-turn-helix domain-containing protein [Clostridia bacterium]|nr:helix-turn-helix domain-containing protein [Clostridia bacterium]
MKNTRRYGENGFIDFSPVLCSVDLMNGSRAIGEAMTQYEKEEYFKMLTEIGFRQINVGSPLNALDAQFISAIEAKGLVPEKTAIQVNVNAEKAGIEETLKAVKKFKKVIVNLHSTVLLREKESFSTAREEAKKSLIKAREAVESTSRLTAQYTVEFFKASQVEKVIELFNDATEIFKPNRRKKIILNIVPVPEFTMPQIFASIIKKISNNLNFRDGVILSFRPSNDRGTGISAAEMALSAGVERIEGALFGIGERAGNIDLVNLAMNLYTLGIDPKIDLSDIPKIRENFERFTGLHIYEKMPYSGESALAVFSPNHQNSIRQAIDGKEKVHWGVPCLAIDPADIGRDFDNDVIRNDGLSGKSGINYVLSKKFGLQIPAKLKAEAGERIRRRIDSENGMTNNSEIYRCFERLYVESTPVFTCPASVFTRKSSIINAETVIKLNSGKSFTVKSEGNGRLDAVSNAFKKCFDVDFDIHIYEEHALTEGSKSKAVSYLCIKCADGFHWGVGINEDIMKSSVNALTVAVNQIKKVRNFSVDTDPRVIEMIDYIKDNFNTVTLSTLAEKFYLSKQYVSKYIKEKSGLTFCENVQKFRMKKAEDLLLTTNMTVEAVAEESGYPSVEHFNRKFKKLHGQTPMQFRKTK